MKFQLRSFLLIVFLLFVVSKSEAQVKTKTFFTGIPDRLLPKKALVRKTITIKPEAEFVRLKKAVETDETVGGIDRYALPHDVSIDVLKEAQLTEAQGVLTYSLNIEAKAAYSLSLRFQEFRLSENSILSIFTDYEITDSISSKENTKKGTWSTRSYHGDLVQLVLRLPSKEKEKILLKIGRVYLGYKLSGVSPQFGSQGSSASCMKNVACPEGAGWAAQSNAVALIDANGAWGTGTMIMNTCGTNTPYLLTAQHGLDGDEDEWNFQFFYFSTDCNSNTGYREDVQFHGAVVRASNTASDFALLQLNQTPAANSGIHYAGWNRTFDFFAFTSTTLLHHPKGDVMKISRDNNGAQSVAFRNSQYWQLALAWGGTQGGSSGGPFFDANRRIIGQHFGVLTANAGNPCHSDAYGGRFDLSWTGGGTTATRLSNWLDPTNTGATATNTTNISNLIPLQPGGLVISGSNNFCSGTSQYSLNVPAGTGIAWTSSNNNVATIDGNGLLSMQNAGSVIITATINSCGTTLVTTKTVAVGFPPLSFPIDGTDFAVPGGQYYFQQDIPYPFPPASFSWQVSSGWQVLSGGNGAIAFIQTGSTGGFIDVAVTACGETRLNSKYVEIGPGGDDPARVGGGSKDFDFTISPNPAKNTAIISITGITNSFEVRVFDLMTSNLVKQQRYDKGQTQVKLQTANLKAGAYVVQITSGGKTKSKQLRVMK